MRLNPRKVRLARAFEGLGLNALLLGAQRALWRPHVRCVNYHDVPPSEAGRFEDQLRFFARHFAPVGLGDLEDLLAGRWRHDKPGLVISFDDGVWTHHEVAAPLLERHGFVGWFFVPSAFPAVPLGEQGSWAGEHQISSRGPRDDGRVAMTWDEVRDLDRRHVVGCHTMTHRRLAAALSDAELDLEVARAKAVMEEQLGREVPVFCWVGGEEWSYSAAAARAIRDAGFRYAFMTNNQVVRPSTDPLRLQRTNLEVYFPFSMTRFQLSGLLDLTYLPKRRRVERLTA